MTNQDTSGPAFDNQCSMCEHKQNPDAGHCYMFRMKPILPCGQHTVPTIRATHTRAMQALITIERMQCAKMATPRNWPGSNYD